MGRVKALPCIVCELEDEIQTGLTDVHHIHRNPETGQPIGGGQRGSHWWVLPLCDNRHHWNGVKVHMGSREFERRHGNELYLLALVYDRLGMPYPWEKAS